MKMDVDGCVVTEGNTVDEAVNKALRMLQITKGQAIIQVIAEGKQGFWGLGSKLAKVKVQIREEAKAELELTDILLDLDIKDETKQTPVKPQVLDDKTGTVTITDGQVVVTNPADLGKYASIKPGNNIRIMVNGFLVEDETPLAEEDRLEVLVVHDEPVSHLELTVSEDKLEAYLKWVYRLGARYKLKDQVPTNKLLLSTTVEEITEMPPITGEDVVNFLQANNVVKGILDGKIQQVVDNPNSKQSILVACGQGPINGIDQQIRYPFMERQETQGEEGLFGRHKLLLVTPGDVVAIRVAAQEGHDGWSLTGEILPAKKPANCEILIKTGCELTDNGDKAVATIAGRPCTDTVGTKTILYVDPVYVVKDVDQATGNIKFAGDIQVTGNVRDGYTIEADGNIEVFGDVTRATVKAGASVVIHKSALGSTITAGGRATLYLSIIPGLKEVGGILEKAGAVAIQLKNSPGFSTSDLKAKGDGPLIQLILDSKFGSVSKTVSELSESLVSAGQPVHEEITNLVSLFTRYLSGLGPVNIERIDFLLTLIELIDQVLNLINSSLRSGDCIKIRYVQNCTLSSSGSVLIEGQGCYISSITAGGEVIVAGNPGLARGVKIVANGNVTVKELGSELDTQTSVKVGGDAKVSAGIIYPNVVVQVGSDKCRIDGLYKNFDAYVNYEGRFIVDKLSVDNKH